MVFLGRACLCLGSAQEESHSGCLSSGIIDRSIPHDLASLSFRVTMCFPPTPWWFLRHSPTHYSRILELSIYKPFCEAMLFESIMLLSSGRDSVDYIRLKTSGSVLRTGTSSA